MQLQGGIPTLLHILLTVFLIIELGLTGYVVSKLSSGWARSYSPSQANFMLFNSIWSLLVLTYVAVTPLVLETLYHGVVALALLAVTTIFWFAGSIALAVFVGVPNCGEGIYCPVIRSVQAAVAFGFFIWAIFTALTALAALGHFRGGARPGVQRKTDKLGGGWCLAACLGCHGHTRRDAGLAG